jgi:hypothetical protein
MKLKDILKRKKGNVYLWLIMIIVPFMVCLFMGYSGFFDVLSLKSHLQSGLDLSLKAAVNTSVIDTQRQIRKAVLDEDTFMQVFNNTLRQNLKLNSSFEPTPHSKLEAPLNIEEFRVSENPPYARIKATTTKKLKLWENQYLTIPITVKAEVRNNRKD